MYLFSPGYTTSKPIIFLDYQTIQTQSYSDVADNSGARKSMCIRVLGTGNRRYAGTGDVTIAVVKEAVPNMSLKRSEVVRAVAACTRKGIKRCNGMIVGFDDNAAVVVNQEGNPRGTRIFGPVARELRDYNFTRVVSSAPEVL
uniref:Large ribosomal subunit protein uL14c n=1 Tax=Dryopteris crassirhizoma TaxID=97234 RepID=A0A4D6JA26_DRYCA|nr:ribosomal protein L14 [Dryopteris crassirhizoma]UIS24486.1 ribosomal protein L14 [Dryopteris filix-mas]